METPREDQDGRPRYQALVDHEYLMSLDLKPYSGQWVSIVDAKLVAHGEDGEKVYNETMAQYPGRVPLLHLVPSEETVIIHGTFIED